MTVSEVVAAELNGVSTNAKIDGVAGHTGSRHHDAVATASCLNVGINDSASEEKSIAPVPPKIESPEDVEDYVVGSIEADVVSIFATLDGGSQEADWFVKLMVSCRHQD